MACKNSSSSTPWSWVIEALASFDKVPTSLLIDLIKELPTDDMGKKAREAVSSRILNDFFTSKTTNHTTNNVESPSGSKVCFESSKRFEDVLFSVWDGSLGSNGRLPEVEMAKYDVEPFVKQKQSSLPKNSLQVVKDSILQGNHPLLAPLKKRSGLVIQPEPKKDLDPNDKMNSKGVIKNSIPAKRGRRIVGESSENPVIVIDECERCLNPTKKHKIDVPQRTELVVFQCPRNSPHNEAKEDNIVSQYPFNADVVIEVSDGTNDTNGAKDNCEHDSVQNMSDEEKDDAVNNHDLESFSDDNRYNDEMANVTNENGDGDLQEKEPSVQRVIDDPRTADKGVVKVENQSTNHDCPEESVAAIYVLRSRKQNKPYKSDSCPQLRRKKLLWTKEEERTLKEGMKRFSDASEKWKKILEFGSNVFIKGRTTIDLKDKWRNLCKRSPKTPK